MDPIFVPSPPPQPTPPPVVVSPPAQPVAVRPSPITALLQIAPAVALALFIAWDYFYRPKPAPYVPPIAAAAVAYRDGVAGTFASVASLVRGDKLKNSDEIGAAFSAHSKPLADAVRQFVKSNTDDKGNMNSAAVADGFDQAAKALGAR